MQAGERKTKKERFALTVLPGAAVRYCSHCNQYPLSQCVYVCVLCVSVTDLFSTLNPQHNVEISTLKFIMGPHGKTHPAGAK